MGKAEGQKDTPCEYPSSLLFRVTAIKIKMLKLDSNISKLNS